MFPLIDIGSLITSLGTGLLAGLFIGLTMRFLPGILLLAASAILLGLAFYKLDGNFWLVNVMYDPPIPGVHWFYFAVALAFGIAVHGVDRLTRPVGVSNPV